MGKIEELLVNKGLYDSMDIAVDDLEEIEKYLTKGEYTGNTIDCFCVHCGTNRVFEYTDSEVHERTGALRVNIFDDENVKARKPTKEAQFRRYLNRRYVLSYRCTRDSLSFRYLMLCCQILMVLLSVGKLGKSIIFRLSC